MLSIAAQIDWSRGRSDVLLVLRQRSNLGSRRSTRRLYNDFPGNAERALSGAPPWSQASLKQHVGGYKHVCCGIMREEGADVTPNEVPRIRIPADVVSRRRKRCFCRRKKQELLASMVSHNIRLSRRLQMPIVVGIWLEPGTLDLRNNGICSRKVVSLSVFDHKAINNQNDSRTSTQCASQRA